MEIQNTEKKETKNKILFAAKKEFAEKGFNGARMSSIAEIAEVNQALLHYYFDSKEKLYESILHTFIGHEPDKGFKKIADLINSWNVSSDIELCALLYMLVHFHAVYQDKEVTRLVTREIADDNGIIKKIIIQYIMPRMEKMVNKVKSGIDQGFFQTSNPKMLILLLNNFIHSYYDGMELLKGTETFDRFYSHSTDFLFDFIVEQTFKALRPREKKLPIPELDREKRAAIESTIKEIAKK